MTNRDRFLIADLKMLKLGSPELERMILQQNGLVTPTPSSALPYLLKLKQEPEPGQEHEHYTQGFAQASRQSQNSGDRDSDDSSEKKSSLTEPIDMKDQERIKLERKRLRNRIAATKCRRKKLERISTLEERVSHLKGENNELSTMVSKLRQQVSSLVERQLQLW